MELDLFLLLKEYPTLLLFVVLGFGYLIGRIKIRTLQLGATAGVMIAGLVAGHLGLHLNPELTPEMTDTSFVDIGDVGFALFIYAVGLQVGPRFFSIVVEDGKKYITLAAIIAGIAFALAWGLGTALQFEPGISTGILAGALTSTPTLAVAREVLNSGLVQLQPGVSVDQIVTNLSVSYAITYLFGLIGLLFLIQLLPKRMGINLHQESQQVAREKNLVEEEENSRCQGRNLLSLAVRAYEVQSEASTGKELQHLQFRQLTQCTIQAVKRDREVFSVVEANTCLQPGDRVTVMGFIDHPGQLQKLNELLGPEVFDSDLLGVEMESYEVTVTNPEVSGKSLRKLGIMDKYNCFLTRLRRVGTEIPPSEDLKIEQGDVLTLIGLKSRLDELANHIGFVEREEHKTDMFTFTFGIAAGIILGQIAVKAGEVSLGLGTAGGLLLAGIFIGFLRSIRPTFGRMPPAALWLLKELGLLLFIASIGVEAGAGLVEALTSIGPLLFLCGVAITTIPLLIGYFCGTRVKALQLNPALLLGALTGAMTSTPALGVITKDAKSSIPALGYTGTYAFANIFLTFAGSLMIRF